MSKGGERGEGGNAHYSTWDHDKNKAVACMQHISYVISSGHDQHSNQSLIPIHYKIATHLLQAKTKINNMNDTIICTYPYRKASEVTPSIKTLHDHIASHSLTSASSWCLTSSSGLMLASLQCADCNNRQTTKLTNTTSHLHCAFK